MLSRLVMRSCQRQLSTTAKQTARYGGSGSGGFGQGSSRFAAPQVNWSVSEKPRVGIAVSNGEDVQGFGVRAGPTLKERLLGPTTGKRELVSSGYL